MEEETNYKFKRISKSEGIQKKLESENKFEILDKSEDIKAIIKMNESMERVRQNFLYKNAMSELGARDCYVDSKDN